ncbi:MAG: transporter substrate-binding domain-containing protein [Clostridia bacterium]|nr:transporter substrate-binding domain-containing protein [Clostridia bacterium]
MRKRFVIAFIIITLTGLLLNIAYKNYTNSNNFFDAFFSNNHLTNEEKIWLEEKGFLLYSSDHDTPPLRYIDENTNQYIGLVVDYMDALSLELGIEIKMQPDIWQSALDNLKTGVVDMVDMYPSDKRSEYYYFTDPIFYQNAIMVIRKSEENIKNVTSLNYRKVAAQRGDYVNEFLGEKAPNAIITNTNDYREAVELLRDGEVDAVVGDESVIYHFLKLYNMTEEFVIHDELLYENQFIIGVPKSEPLLRDILNKGIKNLNRKDTLTRIQQKWFGISTPISNPNPAERYILPFVFILIVVIISAYLINAWNSSLKKEIQIALDESEMALQTTFDGLLHLLVVLNDRHLIVNANLAFLDMFQVELENVLHKEITEFIPVDLNLPLQQIDWRGRFYEANVYQIKASNQSIIVMLKDVTAVRINEKQLLSANKMAAIGQLAAGVAHEIRNPLGLIRNYTYVLKTNDNPSIRETAYTKIEASVERASKIIDNLLNFSSISGLEEHEFNMHDFLLSIIELHEKTLVKSHIHVNMDCDSDLKVKMNIESLKHVFINLISNSIDAISADGEIDINCEVEKNVLKIEFVDTGCGVPEELMSQLFNPFFTTKAPGEGTGLGLYIVYTEVEKLGGQIRVNSKINKGTMFTLTFPYKEF